MRSNAQGPKLAIYQTQNAELRFGPDCKHAQASPAHNTPPPPPRLSPDPQGSVDFRPEKRALAKSTLNEPKQPKKKKHYTMFVKVSEGWWYGRRSAVAGEVVACGGWLR
ncbi:hypothetical protein F383_14972 [Gossypium arboreum]|uniref:Uncharacterized protein n=1 Tax=Gossypium arboreum TaxID=29729 RepID=A0A0B0NF33_GOSAR|nr:hypothetical protein F383_14972 [Gossypium arboreum]